jgi:hypothetical protein
VETNGGPIKKANDLPSRFDTVAKSLHQPLHLDADCPVWPTRFATCSTPINADG